MALRGVQDLLGLWVGRGEGQGGVGTRGREGIPFMKVFGSAVNTRRDAMD